MKTQHIRRDILRHLKNNGKKHYRPKELAKQLGYRDNKTYRQFQEVLGELDERGLIHKAKGGRYGWKPRASKAEGVLTVNPKGFGFVAVEGREEDLFVGPHNLKNALDGDRVRVGLSAKPRGDRQEAEVLEVLERRRSQVVGTFQKRGHFAFVDPDDKRVVQDVYVPREDFGGAEDGDKVVVSIDRFDDPKASPEGRILSVIGKADAPGVRVLSLALSLDVRAEFPKEVEQEAARIPEAIAAEEIARRLDLRQKRVFTIDPEDAKDFDDAIHLEEREDGTFEVGVHIADVSAYVKPGSMLDREAYARGTSVYLVDRVIPMLPEKLSNRLCSLRPREDKLAYSCIMHVTARGRVIDANIVETVIHSHHRFTYDQAQTFIDGGYPDHDFAGDVVQAARLARTLTKKRMREGSVDFDLPEIKVLLDDDGTPEKIVRKERKEANRLIEEFMLLANRTVAERIGKGKGAPPFVYRVHDRPDEEKIKRLANYVRAFGHTFHVGEGGVESKELNRLIQKIQGEPEAPVIEMAALRAMAKAVYSTKNVGHYGLGFRHYTHFTSPIRRYPDLMAHRLLKHYLWGGKAADQKELEAQCDHCSEREQRAVEAERESVRLKQVEYIRDHLGASFDGVVTGVTKFGIFVEMTEVLVEGLLHVRDLDDDYYEYDPDRFALSGQYTGRTFKPGDALRVTVVGANVETREVDLMLAD